MEKKKQTENTHLKQKINSEENELKKWLVNYVGEKLNPEKDEVTVEMIVEVMADEFPEFLMALAEENFIRGYKQGIKDTEVFEKLKEEGHVKC